MKITARISPSETKERTVTLTLEELNLSEEVWASMNNEEKFAVIDEWVGTIDQPYYDLETFSEGK